MTLVLAILYYAKNAFVIANILLCCALVIRVMRSTARISLAAILVGLIAVGLSVLIGNFIFHSDLFTRDNATFSRYADVQQKILYGGLAVCELGLIWEAETYRRRFPSSM